MNTSSPRRAALWLSTLSLPALAQAHPGHDGDHDFTWEFSHLAAHPFATLLGATVLAGVTWAVGRTLRRANATRVQSLRGSQPSLGK